MKRSRWGVTSFALVAVGLAVATARPVEAVGGDLDPGFGTGGKVTTDFAATADEARAVAIQADGKIVAAGAAVGTNGDFALARYRPDGTLDPTFGTGGKVRTDFGSSEQAFALALQPDGKILAAGGGGIINSAFQVARYNADGSLDATFGTGGKVTTSFGFGLHRADGLVVQPDGKIVAAGTAGSQLGALDFAVVRYNANGTLDAAFGTGGKVTTDFGSATPEFAWAVALQPDGRLVVAGFTVAAGGHVFALARYTPSGTLDATFGTGGKVTADFGGDQDWAQAVALQPDGRIVAAGTTGDGCCLGTFDFALARFSAAGTLDPTFGTGGKVTTDFDGAMDNARAVILQADGAILAAGERLSGGNVPGATFDFALARYQANGGLDGTFGTGGKITTDFPGRNDSVFGLALQQDGKIVAAGASSTDFALARYSPGDPASADLVVTQTDAPDPVAVNETLTYDITVRNNGPSAATGVTLTDTLSTGVELATPPPGCTSSSGVVTCSLGTLGAGAASTVTISVTARESGTLANRVSVSANEADPDPSSNSSAVDTVVTASADLAVAIADAPDPVIAGQTLTYTVTVTNHGPSGATGVTLANTLPETSLLASAVATQGTCAEGDSLVSCDLGSLLMGRSATITIEVVPHEGGTLTATARVSANEPDPDAANNASSESTTSTPVADVAVALGDAPDPVFAGQTLAYTVAVTNAGPSAATGVELTTSPPAEAALVSVHTTAGTCAVTAGGTIRCVLGTIAAADSATVTIEVRPGAPGSVVANSAASANETDPDQGNNSADATTLVRPAADLSVTATDEADPVLIGQRVQYRVTVGNNGPGVAHGTLITPLLSGLDFISASGCQVVGNDVQCEVGPLAAGESRTFVINMMPTRAGVVERMFSINPATDSDPDLTNNTAVETTRVLDTADVLLTMQDAPDPVALDELLTYTVTATNRGPMNANGVVLVDELPAAAELVSATLSTGNGCSVAARTVNCDLLRIRVDEVVTLTILVRPTATGTITNLATITFFEGDPTPGDTTAVQTTEVRRIATATTVASSANPSLPGQSVTFTATVVAGGQPVTSGQVLFLDGGVPLVDHTVPVDASGQASVEAPLALGSHPIEARFVGSSRFAQSSAALVQIVSKLDTTITLTSGVNPSLAGQAVTFTATVTANGQPVTDGSVVFLDTGNFLGAGNPYPLDASGQATVTTSTLPTGNRFIQAQYRPGPNHNGSITSLDQTVGHANGRIAFTSGRQGNLEIYSMNADGTGQTRLTVNAATDGFPAWSPNGTKVAFVSSRGGNVDIHVMNADGSAVTRLTTNAAVEGHPAWSPDGTKIAFESNRAGNYEIYTMNADGSAQTRRTNNPAVEVEPAWSPDGTKIAFTSTRNLNAEVYVMNADGSGQTRLTANGAIEGRASWSPDGAKIAFASNRDGNFEIYTMNADGSGQTRRTTNTVIDVEPAWSPDGTKIAFTSMRDGNLEVYAMAADGTAQTRLTTGPTLDGSASWQRVG